jgi:hypothetical protein
MTASWGAPDACTLPTSQQPLRVAEFDDLFAAHLRRLEWHGPATLTMHLTGQEGLADAVRDLAARESSCCSFFDFTTTVVPAAEHSEQVQLRVAVPGGREDVLAALGARATAGIAS